MGFLDKYRVKYFEEDRAALEGTFKFKAAKVFNQFLDSTNIKNQCQWHPTTIRSKYFETLQQLRDSEPPNSRDFWFETKQYSFLPFYLGRFEIHHSNHGWKDLIAKTHHPEMWYTPK